MRNSDVKKIGNIVFGASKEEINNTNIYAKGTFSAKTKGEISVKGLEYNQYIIIMDIIKSW